MIDGAYFVGEDFCLKFCENGMEFGKYKFSSVDFTGFKGESFFLSKVIFANVKVLKNELTLGDVCLYSEVDIHPEGYEFGILALTSTNALANALAEFTVVFDDVIIKMEER